jgi:hypothetical protein
VPLACPYATVLTFILPLLFGVATIRVARAGAGDAPNASRFVNWIGFGFVLRMAAHVLMQHVILFGNGTTSGDALAYRQGAWAVARLWDYQGFGFFNTTELGVRAGSNALLAIHLFGAVTYLNGIQLTSIGCTAIIAFLAAATCVLLVRLGTMVGGTVAESRFVALAMYFSPAFVFHTSEMFKDGIAAFLVVSAVVLAFRLAERFSVQDVLLGILCVFLIWYVRFYMVFLVSAPLILSLLGIRSGNSNRIAIACFAMVVAGAFIIQTTAAEDALEVGVAAYERGTNEHALAYNARGGSGVTFSGSPWVTFPLKLVYTLFSPFPWDFRSRSIGFQVGKIDALISMFFMYRGVRGARRMWKDDRGTLVMFLAVLLPLIVAYAASMANIGLIVRQRIPVVLLGAVLAVRGVPDPKPVAATAEPRPIPRRLRARTA